MSEHERINLVPAEAYGPSAPGETPVPSVMLHADLVSRVFEGMGFDPMTYEGDYRPREMADVELGLAVDARKEKTRCHNVIGIIPGSDPELSSEYLTVGAHLDHLGKDGNIIYYGANDNASSCALILEAAKALAENALKRPVLFILFTAEEIGHYGSLHYVAHPAVPHDEVFLNINIEQIGARTRNFDGIWAVGPAGERKVLAAVRKKAPRIGFGFDSIDTQVPTISGSDTLSFYQKRLPAIILGSGGFPEHHRTGDNVDLIDYEHLSRATAFVKAYIEELGNRTEKYFE